MGPLNWGVTCFDAYIYHTMFSDRRRRTCLNSLSPAYLSCCSFFTSASSAGKSIERRATRELTTSIPDSILRMTFLPAIHSSEWSSGAIRLILTRHGRMGRMSSSRQHASVWMSDFSIALKTRGETGVVTGMTTHRGAN